MQRSHSWHSVKNITGSCTWHGLTLASLYVWISLFETTVNANLYLGSTLKSLWWQLSHESFSSWITSISWCARSSSCRSSDKRANTSACPVRSVCRISLRRSSDKRVRPSMPRQIGLPYFTSSFRWLAFTPFTSSCCWLTLFLILTRLWHCLCCCHNSSCSCKRHDTNWKLDIAEKVCPKDFAMVIQWC